MIPFTNNQRYSQPSTPKLEKISLINNPPIHHPVLGGRDAFISCPMRGINQFFFENNLLFFDVVSVRIFLYTIAALIIQKIVFKKGMLCSIPFQKLFSKL